ncbi:MAG TPA: TerC family protein [Candidatus Binatia bacterium]|nr:TerC family protein [Candidatus Binatia bacterium]
MPSNWIFWIIFNAFVVSMLALDLGVFHRQRHVVGFREAIGWTMVWMGLAGIFVLLIYFFGQHMGGGARPNSQLSLEFITGYLIEQSLSADNLFVFLLIFRYFSVPRRFQHGVLFWGVLGALIMRAIFIATGVTLLNRFRWVVYLFGAILVYSGVRLLASRGMEVHPESNPLLRLFRRIFRVTDDHEKGRFFVRRSGILYATPLALVLVVMETTDLLFAVDSIPAVLAVTREPFIVYTSNVFAILGLRSLFFALSGMIETFHLLHYGISLILVLIGVKMLASNYIDVPTGIALGAVAGILLISIALSLLFPKPATGSN